MIKATKAIDKIDFPVLPYNFWFSTKVAFNPGYFKVNTMDCQFWLWFVSYFIGVMIRRPLDTSHLVSTQVEHLGDVTYHATCPIETKILPDNDTNSFSRKSWTEAQNTQPAGIKSLPLLRVLFCPTALHITQSSGRSLGLLFMHLPFLLTMQIRHTWPRTNECWGTNYLGSLWKPLRSRRRLFFILHCFYNYRCLYYWKIYVLYQ